LGARYARQKIAAGISGALIDRSELCARESSDQIVERERKSPVDVTSYGEPKAAGID
jgi:hypothetical protein